MIDADLKAFLRSFVQTGQMAQQHSHDDAGQPLSRLVGPPTWVSIRQRRRRLKEK